MRRGGRVDVGGVAQTSDVASGVELMGGAVGWCHFLARVLVVAATRDAARDHWCGGTAREAIISNQWVLTELLTLVVG